MTVNEHTLAYIPFNEMERIRATGDITLFANACRVNTLYMIAAAGSGHVGSSLSAMDIVALLHLKKMDGLGDDARGDRYFSSKGHDAPGLYSVMLALGLLPFEQIHQLRRLGGLPGHPDVGTPHIVTNTGSLGMGISKARGMALADKVNGIDRRYYVLLGDGELQEGQFWESLQPTVNRKVGSITAIIDHNKLQSDTFVSEVSDLGDLEGRIRAHGWEVARCDGHDIAAIEVAIDTVEAVVDRPGLIIADTIKAKGAGSMESTHFKKEDRLYKFHSGAPTPELYAEAVNGLIALMNKVSVSEVALTIVDRPSTTAGAAAAEQGAEPHRLIGAYSEALVTAGENNRKLMALSADLALDCGLLEFEKKFPKRFVECGIAEMDMVSQAGGMALNGLLPVVHSFACFLPHRANEHIFNNATERTHVLYVGSLAGVVPGGPGHSHQMVRDIASLGGIPGMMMIEPSCETEVGMAMEWLTKNHSGPGYMRLVSIPVDIPYSLPEGYVFEPGKGCVLVDNGTDVIFIGYGPVLLTEAYKAAALLKETGVGATVLNLPWLNSFDDDWLAGTIGDAELVVTLDNHMCEGGQGEKIAASLAGTNSEVLSIGVEDIPVCGRNDEVLAHHRLDAAALTERVTRIIR